MSGYEPVDQAAVLIIEGRLKGICREMGTRALRSIQSPSASLWNDLGVAMFDERERMIAQAEWLPIHTAGSDIALRNVLDYIGRDRIYPGDFIVSNDPFIMKSGHLPDWSFIYPLFHLDELVGYLYFKTHQYDSGGAYPGCYFPRGYDAHSEGLIIPPTKIFERGEECKEVYALILNNVRGKRIVRWDNMVTRGAMIKAAERITEIYDRYGKKEMERAFDQIIVATEKSVKNTISKWRSGIYRTASAADSDGTLDEPVWVRLSLTVKPDEGKLIFDLSESDENRDFVNVAIGHVKAAIFAALYHSFPAATPHNHGLYTCATIVTKEGTVCDPKYPATTGAQAVTVSSQISECVQLAMAQVAPKDTCAAWTRHLNPMYQGKIRNEIDPRTGAIKYYRIAPFTSDGGSGAIWGYDGWDSVGPAFGGGVFIRAPIEVVEWDSPYRYLRCEWITDSSGDGQFRGAIGCHVEYLNEHDAKTFVPGDAWVQTGNCDGEKSEHFGLLGGRPGPKNAMWIKRKGELRVLKCQDIVSLEPGDIIITECGGGGGVGDPLNRDVDKVRMDALNRYISIEKARDVYGVVINRETFDVDYKATKELREKKGRPEIQADRGGADRLTT